MSRWNQNLKLDFNTVAAGFIFWVFATGAMLIKGGSGIEAMFLALMLTGSGGLPFMAALGKGGNLIPSLKSALAFAGIGLLVSGFSFSTDCAIGFMRVGDISLHACVANSGVGFIFTVMFVAMTICTPVVGLLRLIVGAVRQHLSGAGRIPIDR